MLTTSDNHATARDVPPLLAAITNPARQARNKSVAFIVAANVVQVHRGTFLVSVL